MDFRSPPALVPPLPPLQLVCDPLTRAFERLPIHAVKIPAVEALAGKGAVESRSDSVEQWSGQTHTSAMNEFDDPSKEAAKRDLRHNKPPKNFDLLIGGGGFDLCFDLDFRDAKIVLCGYAVRFNSLKRLDDAGGLVCRKSVLLEKLGDFQRVNCKRPHSCPPSGRLFAPFLDYRIRLSYLLSTRQHEKK